jgi:hypothetical protein
MQTHASKHLMRPQRVEKRAGTVDVKRLGLGAELAF